MEALRDLADDFNVRDPRKLYRLARQRDLDVRRHGRVLGKSAAEGPLQADLIDFSQNTRGKTKYGLVVMDVFTREAAVEPLQNKNAETVGRATKRATQELTGDDKNFVVRPGAARGSRAPNEAPGGPQRHGRGGPGNPDAEEGQWSDHFEQTASAYNARPHETVRGAPEDVEKQPATEFRVLQDNADRFQHNKT